MPRIKQQSIDQVRSQASIVDVAGRATQLQRSGRQLRGISPFTQEKSPSFYVNPEKNVWFCYSSGQGGDVIKFVMLHERLEFTEAVETLAERFNIELEYEEGRAAPGVNRSLKKELLEIHARAADYYRSQLLADTPLAAKVRDYWTGRRNFPLDVAKDWSIGFAPDSPRDLIRELLRHHIGDQALRECGMFRAHDYNRSPEQYRGFFRSRLMIPIRDAQGQVIAFTARVIPGITPEDDPTYGAKYVNSPETALFRKGDLVFGIDRASAAISRLPANQASFTLVEGQLDCIRCHTAGITNAVAPQGTAITSQQMLLLKRFANRVDVLLDGDAAGQKGAFRMLPLAWGAGLDVRFLPLPPGKDPDSLLAEAGAAGVEPLKAAALSPMRFAVNHLLPQGAGKATPQERTRALRALCEAIASCEQANVRNTYLVEACNLLICDRHDGEELLREALGAHRPQPGDAAPAAQPSHAHVSGTDDKLTTSESVLLSILLHHKGFGESLSQGIDLAWLDKTGSLHGRILARVLAELREGMLDESLADLDGLLEDDAERNLVDRMRVSHFVCDQPEHAIQQALHELRKRHIQKSINELNSRLANLPPDSPEIFEILARIKALRSQQC